ncbi:MAG: hypothetical protein ACLFQK_10840 [Fibrobacterota bacterium]
MKLLIKLSLFVVFIFSTVNAVPPAGNFETEAEKNETPEERKARIRNGALILGGCYAAGIAFGHLI